ncbi:hypothetical protein Hanom_Chr08g00725031 [Helianthus anomalus]
MYTKHMKHDQAILTTILFFFPADNNKTFPSTISSASIFFPSLSTLPLFKYNPPCFNNLLAADLLSINPVETDKSTTLTSKTRS